MSSEIGANGVTGHSRLALLAHHMPDLLYGSLVAGSVLAVSSVHAPTTDHVALAVAGVVVVYWLAHVYVEAVGGRFEDQDHTTHFRLLMALRDNTHVLIGALPPIAMFLLLRLLGLDIRLSATIALWSTMALLALTGGVAGYLAGARGWALAVEIAVAGGMGLVVVALKYLLH